MKKFLASLLIVCTLLVCMTVCAFAEDYKQGDELEQNWPAIWTIYFDPTDISDCIGVSIDFYFETAANFAVDSLELGSHHNNDWKELTFNGNNGFADIHDGWNEGLVFAFDAKSGTSDDINPDDGTEPGFDPATFQRIRMYNVSGAGSNTVVKIKNICGIKADGTKVPCGAAAPVDPEPTDPTPDDPTPTDPEPTDPNPGTFDAASSVAVFAVAALGIALVASKKRH